MTSRADADVEELTVKAARVHRALLQVRGRATSSDGEVTIAVSIDGRITDMVVSQSFSQLSSDAAGAAIVRTHSEALASAERAASEIRRELTEDYRVARIVDRVATERPLQSVDDNRVDDRKSIYDRW
ncbi:YbaB/EbfC family nucleoid-associated protein [Rhodococcus sp. IEGM 1354]|uniref:YbaB/EbfC family nucleoid-associated protein n=1 Tax=Rhodococcus sp. IEGM 1354 TaxID=3047088 RepID=UPI0024B6D5DA|nr:YbaB/EbfC family nucleoid-associated protein [Rhodococcus sp. IEGM 1354]MDI9933251.1 YbaB/EbfC family nucleoid-associated protein [Rhodococcus sp. IEGM 1354]